MVKRYTFYVEKGVTLFTELEYLRPEKILQEV